MVWDHGWLQVPRKGPVCVFTMRGFSCMGRRATRPSPESHFCVIIMYFPGKQHRQAGLPTLCPSMNARPGLVSTWNSQETRMKATLAAPTEHCGLSTSSWSIPKSGRTRPAKPRSRRRREAGEDHRWAPPEFCPPPEGQPLPGPQFLTYQTGVTFLSSFRLRKLEHFLGLLLGTVKSI